jgi:hypothetical protein
MSFQPQEQKASGKSRLYDTHDIQHPEAGVASRDQHEDSSVDKSCRVAKAQISPADVEQSQLDIHQNLKSPAKNIKHLVSTQICKDLPERCRVTILRLAKTGRFENEIETSDLRMRRKISMCRLSNAPLLQLQRLFTTSTFFREA